MKFFGEIKNGSLALYKSDSARLNKALLKLEGPYTVKLTRTTKKRSGPQLKYYWGVMLKIISDETGHDIDECHHFLGMKFFFKEVKIGNELQRQPRSMSDYGDITTKEFNEIKEKIQAWASEFGIEIPDPNEV